MRKPIHVYPPDKPMTLEPLLNAPLPIQIHVAAVVPAALLGPIVLLRRKGTPMHKMLGRIWLGLMVVAAGSSFFIHELPMFMSFSVIHLLSVWVIYASFLAIRAARQHRIESHRRAVTGLYFGGILGAGAFTLLPGRIMNAVVFTPASVPTDWTRLGHLLLLAVVIIAVVAILTSLAARQHRSAGHG